MRTESKIYYCEAKQTAVGIYEPGKIYEFRFAINDGEIEIHVYLPVHYNFPQTVFEIFEFQKQFKILYKRAATRKMNSQMQ